MTNLFKRIVGGVSSQSISPTDRDPAVAAAAVMDQIGYLEMTSRRIVDGLLAGRHRSTTKGGCSEFAGHRQYAPGDEIRGVDWQVYARSDRYFIKQFEEETNLQAVIALDASGSMRFGLSTPSKLQIAQTIAACLTRILIRARDAVGLSVLTTSGMTTSGIRFIPPRQHASHVRAILRTLAETEADGDCDVAAGIVQTATRMRRRGMFILVSDCFSDLTSLTDSLRIVTARGHDVIVVQVIAPEEWEFDFRRHSRFDSLEHAGRRVRLDPPTVRAEYVRRMHGFVAQLRRDVIGLGGDHVLIRSDQDLADSLGGFLRNRAAR